MTASYFWHEAKDFVEFVRWITSCDMAMQPVEHNRTVALKIFVDGHYILAVSYMYNQPMKASVHSGSFACLKY